MAKMKIEALARPRRPARGRPCVTAWWPRCRATAGWPLTLAPLANLRNRVPALARLGERIPWHGRLPPPARLAAGLVPRRRGYDRDGDVLLLADTFNRYFEPENLRAAVRVLRAAGFRPAVPSAGARPLCCGRTYLSAGMVDRARAEATRTMAALAGDRLVVGLEPSCLLTLRDEFTSLLPGPAARSLADRALLIGEFLQRHAPDLPLGPLPGTAHIHGHCHQKAFGAFPDAVALLKRVPDLTVQPITSSCCGMAGAFGYGATTQEASRGMAEAGLLPALRAAGADAIIVADGTSCRHQIADLAGRTAVHSIRMIDKAITGTATATALAT